MKKILLLFNFNFELITSKNLLVVILIFSPIFFFALSTEPSNQNITNNSSITDTATEIFMSSGAVMVGAENVHHADIVQIESSEGNPKVIENPLNSEIIIVSKGKKEVDDVRIANNNLEIIETKSVANFNNYSSTNSKFLANAISILTSVVLPTNSIQKFIFGNTIVYKDLLIASLERNKNFYNSISYFQHLTFRCFSLRAPPFFT